MRYLLYAIVLSAIFFLAACRQNQSPGNNKTAASLPAADTTNPFHTYEKLKNEQAPVIDTVYHGLLTSLNDSNNLTCCMHMCNIMAS